MVMRVVVMGVAGSGKTTVGARVADRLGARFLDADDLHPPANIDKMAAGQPLDDHDRRPWLQRVRDELRGEESIVVACSALTRRYRDVLRQAGGVQFVFLDLDAVTARQRTEHRTGHFMGTSMIASQFEALEPPSAEPDVTVIDARNDLESVVEDAVAALDPGVDEM